MTISDNSVLKVNNMPPKGRRVHNTRSVSGTRSRANSPLVVKVNNDMAKAKQPKQTKAKLKSIVKVVKNTTNAAATKKVSFRQGPAPLADHQPVEQQWAPDTPWNVIDQQLWATTLHGIHTLPHQGNPQQYMFKPRQQQQQQQGKGLVRSSDNKFKNCFDFNRGGCTHPSCTFPHVCGRCGSPAHTTVNCLQKKQQQQGAVQPMATTAASRGHVHPTNTTQTQMAGRAVAIPSRQ